jgi:tetratricopeptide (TPR) repeat protein
LIPATPPLISGSLSTSQYLSAIGGRAQESIEEANRARQLDPLSVAIGWAQADAYSYDRQFEKANELFQKLIADNPTSGGPHWEFAYSEWDQRKYPQTIQEFATAGQLLGDKNMAEFAAALDSGFHSGGWPGALRKGIEVSLVQRRAKNGRSSAYLIAVLYADLGDKDRAFEWLNAAYQEHDYFARALRVNPLFDSLRSDPRYAELLRKIGFPQ